VSHRRFQFLLGWVAIAIAAPTHAETFPNACSAPRFASATATSIDSLCGLAGSGGPEAPQNEAKNNFCPTAPAKAITIAEMVDLQKMVEQNKSIPFGNDRSHPLSSTHGPAQDRAPLVALGESTEVILTGFVLVARQEGAESVNCEKTVPDVPANHDIHISIVDSASNTVECTSVVVEMSPHHRPAAWNHANVEAVATAHLPVRVTGQLFFDSSHTPCGSGGPVEGDPSRASLWEVHPIYAFDVCTQGDCRTGGWVPLEQWKATPRARKGK